ncbi:phenylalanine--tRNA ligase subunit beta [bacterium]|nr:phenylalanine--tRNA ligase subunit beta [bacterium]
MLISYKWLKDYIKGTLPPAKKLAELITMHSFEVEEIKKKGSDWLIDLAVLPNRAHDCLSYIGIARECAVIIPSLDYKKPESVIREDSKVKTDDFVEVEVKEKNLCRRYTGKVVIEVKIAPSPKEIQWKLRAMGLEPINNVVDILNFVMFETGQPLHAFDLDKLEGGKKKRLIVRKAKKGEIIYALDDKKYILDDNILVIADPKDVLAIAGIKGGKKAEISESTKRIVIESANFDMKTIRYARQKLNLQTDASLRFEHEPDPNLTLFAINRAVHLIQKYCNGKPTSGIVDVYPKKVLPHRIKLDISYAEKMLGIGLKKEKIKKIFKKLGLKIISFNKNVIYLEIPTFRQDLKIPEDLVEEIGRIYGFENIPAKIPLSPILPSQRNDDIFWEDFARDILKEVGFSEVYNYSFISEEIAESFFFAKEDLLELENPISKEYKYLRPSLIPNLIKNVKDNSKYFSKIKIFELGKIYKQPGILEKRALSGLVASEEENEREGENFYYLKGIIDVLLNRLGISNIWYDEFQPTPEESKLSIWEKEKCAEIKVDNIEIGFLGEISHELLERLGISFSVVVFDFDFEKLQKLCLEEHEYQPISRFPAAVRDLAVLVPIETKVVEVLNKINQAGGMLVRDVDLFDIYQGKNLPEGKKNLAFHIIYQAKDRTLSKEEIDQIQAKIIKALEKNPYWEVRK